ncbi:hypothetical protein RQP46_007651 [Phenoliferia psychrophenolica]
MAMDPDAPSMKRQRTADAIDDEPKSFTVLLRGSESRTVRLNRSPSLFPHIQNWLCGYDILPLPAIADMSPAVALANLLKDAQYFGLSKLEELLTTPVFPSVEPHDSVLAKYGFGRKVTLDDISSGRVQLERDASRLSRGFYNVEQFIPILGERDPPLVLLQNVVIQFQVQFDYMTGYMCIIGSADELGQRMDLPFAAPYTTALRYRGGAFAFYHRTESEDDEADRKRDEDAFLSLDGISTTLAQLCKVMHDAAKQVVLGRQHERPILNTPLETLVVEQLALVSDLPSAGVTDPAGICFSVVASELWVVPEQTTSFDGGDNGDRQSDDDVVDEFSFRIVAANCYSKGSGTLKTLSPPLSPIA